MLPSLDHGQHARATWEGRLTVGITDIRSGVRADVVMMVDADGPGGPYYVVTLLSQTVLLRILVVRARMPALQGWLGRPTLDEHGSIRLYAISSEPGVGNIHAT